jgi:hypothetical protein
MNTARTILSIILIVLFASCEKIFIENDPENTHENNFELLWSTIDEKYSFFEFKKIDWDSIYHIFRPLVNNGLSDREFFDLMAELLFELRDGHVNLYSDFDRSRNWEWYAGYPSNFNLAVVERYYLGENSIEIGPFSVTEIDSVGYIYSGTFIEKVKESDIDKIIDKFSGMKGIVFDVRNNTGGFSSNGKIIAGRFADRSRLVSWNLYKTGPGHGDFSKPQPNYIYPQGSRQFIKPVVVIANRRTYSATNDFVLNMSAFPHVTVIGDTTGGGGGTPYDYELLNGWRFRFPRTKTIAPNGFNVEHGVPPAIQVNLTRGDEQRGIDTILEAAIRYIRSADQ